MPSSDLHRSAKASLRIFILCALGTDGLSDRFFFCTEPPTKRPRAAAAAAAPERAVEVADEAQERISSMFIPQPAPEGGGGGEAEAGGGNETARIEKFHREMMDKYMQFQKESEMRFLAWEQVRRRVSGQRAFVVLRFGFYSRGFTSGAWNGYMKVIPKDLSNGRNSRSLEFRSF